MNGVVECINGAGRSFVEWSAAMLVQSSVLIGILFGVDLLIRKRVRAVVRYWIWMLVLVKLVLPPSLSSPFGLGAFLPATRQITAPFSSAMPDPQPKPVSSPPVLADPSLLADVAPAAPRLTERPDAGNLSPGTRPSWQGSALMIWLVVAMTLLLLLAQRAMFVRGLVRQAQDADGPMRSLLAEACTRMGLKARPAIRLSPNAASPAVCGLWRPVILVPQDLARRLQPEQARSVLLHELAHIKRGDLWVNLIQTLLQIAYFYNPLLWLANWRIRRVREQAVDEAVLVAMRDRASEYPETLVGVARMTFARPALGLRLIGVVESKGALRGRIRHMLGRPFPKTARLGLCGLAVLTLMGVVFLPMAASQERRETDESLAWQRTDLYVPPDPNGFFPDDPEGGKRLDALFDAPDRNRRSDEEVLSTVRQGLLRTSKHKTLILQWIGNRYVWNKDPQDAQAIEILYHAVPLERHYAVYFGLSVVKDKSPNILRTLAEICMEGEEVGRVTWGIRDQKDQLLSYIRPHLQDTDPARREVAEVLVRHFAGQVNFETWKAQRELERKKVQFGDQMPQLREQLLTGDSAARRKAFGVIAGNGLTGLMDDTFLEAMEACAKDPDRRVRNEVARTAGGRWVWNAQEHSPRAVALMRVLAADEDRDVRYNAVYFGLSTVRQKDQAVIGQLVDMALKDREPNLYGRIVWGLKGLNAEQQGWLKELLLERAGRTSTSPEEKASIYDLYKATLDMAPPADFWGPREVLQGRVLDWQDQPVAGAAVVICDANSGVPLNRETFRPISEGFPQGDPSAVAFAVTDQDGRFQAGVPAGSYRLVAQSWRDAAAIKGPLEKNGEEVRLHG
ncbi:MAG: M48 family metalloprotease, partial [Phycisphaerae bacterium]|nr:M48 family metalloprotease [Phycisphaerae bacterium]